MKRVGDMERIRTSSAENSYGVLIAGSIGRTAVQRHFVEKLTAGGIKE